MNGKGLPEAAGPCGFPVVTAHRWSIAGIVAIATVLVLAHAQSASAVELKAQAPYSWWSFPSTNFYSLAQKLTVVGHDPGIHRFWAYQFGFVGGDAGYMGLQVGSAPNNTKIALFSIFRANGHSGTNCTASSEVGIPFHSCRLDPYNWIVGREYRLRVWDLRDDAQGTWYGAWVQDTVTGTETKIGELRVPTSWGGLKGGAGNSVSWTERFSTGPSACAGIGWSRARWGFPVANNGTIEVTARSQDISDGDCPGWVRVLHVAGVDVQEMGKSSTETSWCGNLFPTAFGPIARCTKTDPTSLFVGNFSPVTGGFTHEVGPLTAIDRREHLVSYPASDGSGTFPFYGGPQVSTAFGPASYGEQRWPNSGFGPLLRLGSVNFITGLFYPDGDWVQDTGP